MLAVEIVRKNPDQVGFAVNPRRWVVERFFAWIGRNRRLSKDFEATIDSAQSAGTARPKVFQTSPLITPDDYFRAVLSSTAFGRTRHGTGDGDRKYARGTTGRDRDQ